MEYCDWEFALGLMAEMPDRTVQHNTITCSLAIMLVRRMGNDSLHVASWLR